SALTAFLTGATTPAVPLATLTHPARLPTESASRQQLLRLALQGCLLALQEDAAAPRGRFYLRAEPGLVALLLYGVSRRLPQGLARRVPFSTFENSQANLRGYRLGQIVGTWTATPNKPLDPDFFTTLGYGLDTFTGQVSEELMASALPVLDALIELAAR